MTKVDYTLSGCANGHPVRIEGAGTVGRSAARLRLRAQENCLLFDAGLAYLVAVDAMLAMVGRIIGGADNPIVARCRVDLFAEGGVAVGTIAAVATIGRHRGRLQCRAQLVEARVAAEVGERVMAISERTCSPVQVGGDTVLMSAGTVGTSRGREWTALCSTLLVATETGHGASITIPPLSVGRSGN